MKTIMSENRDICSPGPAADWMIPAPTQYIASVRKFIIEDARACIGAMTLTSVMLLSSSLPLASVSLACWRDSALYARIPLAPSRPSRVILFTESTCLCMLRM